MSVKPPVLLGGIRLAKIEKTTNLVHLFKRGINLDPNLTYPIIFTPNLNATLYQPQEGLNEWLKINFFGIVQIVMAAVLAYLTYELWRTTSRYADQVGKQTDIMARNTELSEATLEIEEIIRQRNRLKKEMDKLIGPLYSRIEDKQIFNPRGTGGGRYWKDASSHEIDKQLYEEGCFWQEVARYKYLAPLDLRTKIDEYLKMKLGSATIVKWDNPEYAKSEEELKDAVKKRYRMIETELSKSETQLETH